MQHGHHRMWCAKYGRCGGSRACWPVPCRRFKTRALRDWFMAGMLCIARQLLLLPLFAGAGKRRQDLPRSSCRQDRRCSVWQSRRPCRCRCCCQSSHGKSQSARVVVRGCFRQWKQQAQAQGARRRLTTGTLITAGTQTNYFGILFSFSFVRLALVSPMVKRKAKPKGPSPHRIVSSN